jgi:A/G-specific adenine glycosylase
MSRRTPPLDTSELDPAAVARMQERIFGWYSANRRDLPWRRTVDPYAILVSEVMLQQTQVPRVVPKYEAFLAAYPALEDLAAAPLGDVLRLWQGLGYNNRARRLRDCAVAAVAVAAERRTPGDGAPKAGLPRTLEGLNRLPGLGPYTGRAVLIFAYNDDLAAVDANVRRVLTHELVLREDLGARELQAVADAVLPPGRSRDWHNALMDFGALVLTARTTGITTRTRQGSFEGSRRWFRSRLLRALLQEDAIATARIPGLLGLDSAAATQIVALLEADGLVRRDGDLVRIV